MAPRSNFPNMPTWGDWDYQNLAHRTRKPRNDNRTRQEAREYFMLNFSGELRFEQSAGNRYYSQYRPRDMVTDVEAERYMNEVRRKTTSTIGNPRSSSAVRPRSRTRPRGH